MSKKSGVLLLDDEARRRLRKPLGKLMYSVHEAVSKAKSLKKAGGLVVTVGDRTTINFISSGLIPDLAVVDGVELRSQAPKIRFDLFNAVFRVKNPAGTIDTQITHTIREGLSNPPSLIYVDGEEDLLTLLVCASSGEGTSVFYGQPKKGVVMITLDSKIKRRVQSLLNSLSG